MSQESTSVWIDSDRSAALGASGPRSRRMHVYQISKDAPGPVDSPREHPVKRLQRLIITLVNQNRSLIRGIILSALFICYTIYFAFAVRHSVDKAMMLIVITGLVAGYMVYAWIRDTFGAVIFRALCVPIGRYWDSKWHITRWFLYTAVILGPLLYLIIAVITSGQQLQSLGGLFLFFIIPWLTSKHPTKVQWRPVIWGMLLQFLIGCLVLRWRSGYKAVQFLADEFSKFLGYSLQGGSRVFGDPYFFRHPFAMLVSPLIIYMGCVMSILYYWGVVQWVAAKIGWLMSISLKTTSIESVSLAVNIFLSVLDSVLMLKNYMPLLTASEFHCFLVGAHSTIAGFAFGLFIMFGVSPQHLLTGAVMSAPAAVALAKLNYPETEQSLFKQTEDLKMSATDEYNFIDAGLRGAWAAGKSIGTILFQTLSFLAMFSFLDTSISWFFDRVGIDLTISTLLGYMFVPLAFLMGIEWADTQEVGRLLGLKVTANEFLAYIELGLSQSNGNISNRSAAIATYAMCGFSSFGTLVIFSAVWQVVDPQRTAQVIKQIPRIMLNANFSCFMTACLASILYSEDIEVEEGNSALGEFAQFGMQFIPDYNSISALFKTAINF